MTGRPRSRPATARDRDELVAALAEAKDLPDGADRVARLERVVADADATGDVRLGFDSRLDLMDALDRHGGHWRMLAPLRWCLAAYDREPAAFDPVDAELLRWQHRRIVAVALRTPRIGLDFAVAALDDLERRLTGADGRVPEIIYSLRCGLAEHVGDEVAARRWLARWWAAERDENSDCAGCDAARQAELLAGWGDWSAAVAVAEPVLRGVLGCTEQPERALVAVAVPYLRLGRYDEAARAHVIAYRRHRRERSAFPHLAAHLRFCALTGHLDRGLDVLAEHLGRLAGAADEAAVMEFAAAGALVCRLATEAGRAARVVHRPGYADRPAADLDVAALGADLLALAQDFAGRFDARNGTAHQSGRLAGWLADRPLTDGVPLPPDGPSDGPGATPAAADDDGPDGPADSGPHGTTGPGSRERAGGLPDLPPPLVAAAVGRLDPVGPLTAAGIAAVLARRADHEPVTGTACAAGRWGGTVIRFDRIGERGEILQVRVDPGRRLRPGRLADGYAFCNAWNHDHPLPKAYVRASGPDGLALAGDVTTDLGRGVTDGQLRVLIDAAISAGLAFAAAVAALP